MKNTYKLRVNTMDKNQYFKFEENTDFPYYKNSNFLTKKEGILLISSVAMFMFFLFGPVHFLKNQTQLLLFFATIIPLLYLTSGKLNSLFKKPRLKDIELIILSVIGTYILQFVLTFIFALLGINSVFEHTSTVDLTLDSLNMILHFIQVIAEELFRVFIFLIMLHIIHKYTNNRKQSIIIGTLITLVIFGLMHTNSYNNIWYNIVYIGLGGFFTFYPYLKTKNVLLSIIVHFILNMVITILTTIGLLTT